MGYPPSQPSPHKAPQQDRRSLTDREMFCNGRKRTIRWSFIQHEMKHGRLIGLPDQSGCRNGRIEIQPRQRPSKSHNAPAISIIESFQCPTSAEQTNWSVKWNYNRSLYLICGPAIDKIPKEIPAHIDIAMCQLLTVNGDPNNTRSGESW